MNTTYMWKQPKYKDNLKFKKPDLKDRTQPELTQP